jgi:flagellar motor switch protein FliM
LITVPVPANLSPMHNLTSGRDAREEAVLQRERAMDVRVEVTAELARISMALGVVRNLNVGDIVPLGPGSTSVLRVQDRPVLEAEPGLSDGYRSVRVIQKLG